MRKLILYLHVTIDEFVQGEHDWDINWVVYDEELEQDADETFSTVDTVLWGAVHTWACSNIGLRRILKIVAVDDLAHLV